MNVKDLRPVGQLAQFYGMKCVLYGTPGVGKTPVINTAPNPVMLVCEPGLLSMRNSAVPAFEGYTVPRIREFFKWFFESAEAKKFDTLCVDSISQMAEIYLAHYLKLYPHGLQAYGEMAKDVIGIVDGLYFMPQKHVCLIAKQTLVGSKYKPYFPGQELNVKIPHRYDAILFMALSQVPGVTMPVVALRTKESFECMARDRSGKLAEYEEPNLANIFSKVMI